ncbi:MAG TPA: endolytic transglycosylase MltG [Galbitalea sp.]|jgi:UPF0755 protein
MADEPTWDDLFGQQPVRPPQYNTQTAVSTPPEAPETSRRAAREQQDFGGGSRNRQRKPKKRRSLAWLWVLIALVVVGAIGAGIVWTAFGPQIRHVMGWEESIDYTGNGDGQAASIVILSGQNGDDIAHSLAKAGVTKTSAAFYTLLLKQKTQPNFEPGTYKLQMHMSAKAALTDLENPTNRITSKLVIPEGMTLPQILAKVSASTGVPLAELQSAAKNYTQFGVPSAAPSLEGFLFPATYTFDPGTPAKTILQTMVNRMNQSLAAHGVSKANELKVLTLASVIQKEGGSTSDFYKVSRVFINRINQGIPLQSDATVSYGAHSNKIATTAAQRADASNKYNTYAHTGLPVGPIAAPGDAAIDAALHPATGSWLYFVLVNGYTGATVFSDTLAEHNTAVKQWQAWLRAHPGYGQ